VHVRGAAAVARVRAVTARVLVTGCSTGIGRATALHLAAGGFHVYATAREVAAVEGLRAAGCELLELDVADDASRRGAVAAAEPLDVLVNNAGYSQSGAVETVPLERVRRQFETNVFGAIELAKLVLPGMRARGRGRIINVSSMGGRFTFPGGGVYHASKHALEAFSDALRFEVAGFGVAVVLIEPGIVRTEFSATAAGGLAEVSPDEGPYAGFEAAVGAATLNAYERGALARLGAEPGAVARAIERAIRARSPRARYRVTPSASLLIGLRRALPDALWDRFLAASFPRPSG
jgi:NAD(P)-dependent dehydrogenase (short-subunit alcohol dehydrogenase family)